MTTCFDRHAVIILYLDVITFQQKARIYVRRTSEPIFCYLKTGCCRESENSYNETSVTTTTR